MRRKRKKRYGDIQPPTVDVDNLVIDTTRKERFQLFEVLASIRKLVIILLIISGSLSTFLSVQFLMGTDMLVSSLSFIALAAIAFIGVANITCGLLLLASES
jgi:hypothetical protein